MSQELTAFRNDLFDIKKNIESHSHDLIFYILLTYLSQKVKT